MELVYKGITSLLASAVTGEDRKLPEGFSLEEAMPIIKKQHLMSLVFQGAVNCGISTKDPVMQKLMQQYIKIMVHSEKQMRAVQQLFDVFEKNEIDHLPLKGCRMKALYPKPELRTMGDADILIRVEQYDKLEKLMTSLGYTLINESHYEYKWSREDLMVELHKGLMAPVNKEFYQYFGDGWSRGIKRTAFQYEYSPEDTFVYQFVHMAKHYRRFGIGSRHILDLYVFLRSNRDLDETYIKKELDKLHLKQFYRNMRRVFTVWFEDGTPDEITEYITEYIFSGGSWGTFDNGIVSDALLRSREKGEIRNSRQRSLIDLIFPSAQKLEIKYPILKKHAWLLPMIWVIRWFDVLLFRRRNIRKRMSEAASVTDEKIMARKTALEYVGLSLELDPMEEGT